MAMHLSAGLGGFSILLIYYKIGDLFVDGCLITHSTAEKRCTVLYIMQSGIPTRRKRQNRVLRYMGQVARTAGGQNEIAVQLGRV